MKRTVLITLFAFCILHIQAQWVGSLQTGISTSIWPARNDYTSDNQSGFHLQATGTYFFGHLGIGITAGYLQQGPRQISQAAPLFFFYKNNMLNRRFGAFYLLAGPEICISCGPKFRLNLHGRVGVSVLPKKTVQYSDTGLVSTNYSSKIVTKAPFTISVGAAGYYTLNRRMGIGLNIDHTFFKSLVEGHNLTITPFYANHIYYRHFHRISLLNIATSFIYKL